MNASRPLIAVTTSVPARQPNPELASRKNQLLADAVAAAGGSPLLLNAIDDPNARLRIFAEMDGLVLGGGEDVDPGLYGDPNVASQDVDPDRDELDRQAWQAASDRRVPVLGTCRGFEFMNVMRGGRLLQHVDDHDGPGWGEGAPRVHSVQILPDTRLAQILFDDPHVAHDIVVNSHHHQGVLKEDLGEGMRVSAQAESPAGLLVEAFESVERETFLFGLQFHPERTESVPVVVGRLWRALVLAAESSHLSASAEVMIADPSAGHSA